MTDPQRSSILKTILIAAGLTLVVSAVRLVGELQGFSPEVFSTEPGGGGSPLGISWLVPLFGFWFGRRLARNGRRPGSTGRALLLTLVGVALVAGLIWATMTQIDGWREKSLAMGVGGSVLGLFAALAFPSGWFACVVYGALARLPVALIQYLAVTNGWDTHYSKGPPEAPAADALFMLTTAQLSFWPFCYTALVGTLTAILGAATVRRQ